jgi:molecular chaperone GrpE (heat shock protein)
MIIVLNVDIYAMDQDQFGVSKSRSFGSYPTSFDTFKGFKPASPSQFELQFDFDKDADSYCDDSNQDEQNNSDIDDMRHDNQFERAISSPRFTEVSLGLYKTDREFLSNLLRLSAEYQRIDQFFNDLKTITDENRQQLLDFAVQIFIVAVGRLDSVTQNEWREVLAELEREKEKLKREQGKVRAIKERSSRPVAPISDERWESQKGLMARQLNVIMMKIFTELQLAHDEIRILINQHQSSFASFQKLSSSWSSCSIKSPLSSDE